MRPTFETFELQRPMYVRCKPHVPLLNLNRTHAPSEGDGRTIHDNINIYIYTDSAGVDRTRRGSPINPRHACAARVTVALTWHRPRVVRRGARASVRGEYLDFDNVLFVLFGFDYVLSTLTTFFRL